LYNGLDNNIGSIPDHNYNQHELLSSNMSKKSLTINIHKNKPY